MDMKSDSVFESCLKFHFFGLSAMVCFFELEVWGAVMSWKIEVLLFELAD